MDMTHKMCAEAGPAAAFLLETAPIHACAALQVDGSPIPARAGTYALWGDEAAWSLISAILPVGPAPAQREGRRVLYVGIAPREPAPDAPVGSGTLLKRLTAHLHGPSRYSTLRRSLACVLRPALGLAFDRGSAGKLRLIGDGELVLSTWIGAHLSISWAETAAPWKVEAAILAGDARPPLNIAGPSNVAGAVSPDSAAPAALRRLRRRSAP